MRPRQFRKQRASYSITEKGQQQLQARRARLEAKRARTMWKLDAVGRRRKAGLPDLAASIECLYQIDKELTRIDMMLYHSVQTPGNPGTLRQD